MDILIFVTGIIGLLGFFGWLVWKFRHGRPKYEYTPGTITVDPDDPTRDINYRFDRAGGIPESEYRKKRGEPEPEPEDEDKKALDEAARAWLAAREKERAGTETK